MEREFGISCPSGLPKDQYQEDILDLETCDSQEELERSQSIISQKEEEKNKVGDALLAFFMTGIMRNIKMPKTCLLRCVTGNSLWLDIIIILYDQPVFIDDVSHRDAEMHTNVIFEFADRGDKLNLVFCKMK